MYMPTLRFSGLKTWVSTRLDETLPSHWGLVGVQIEEECINQARSVLNNPGSYARSCNDLSMEMSQNRGCIEGAYWSWQVNQFSGRFQHRPGCTVYGVFLHPLEHPHVIPAMGCSMFTRPLRVPRRLSATHTSFQSSEPCLWWTAQWRHALAPRWAVHGTSWDWEKFAKWNVVKH